MIQFFNSDSIAFNHFQHTVASDDEPESKEDSCSAVRPLNRSKTSKSLLAFKEQIQSLRILACKQLRQHVSCCHVSSHSSHIEDEMTVVDDERVERLLLRINMLKRLNSSVMEELFFSDVIGTVKIDNLIPSIICSEICTANTPADSPRPPAPAVASSTTTSTLETSNCDPPSSPLSSVKVDENASSSNDETNEPNRVEL